MRACVTQPLQTLGAHFARSNIRRYAFTAQTLTHAAGEGACTLGLIQPKYVDGVNLHRTRSPGLQPCDLHESVILSATRRGVRAPILAVLRTRARVPFAFSREFPRRPRGRKAPELRESLLSGAYIAVRCPLSPTERLCPGMAPRGRLVANSDQGGVGCTRKEQPAAAQVARCDDPAHFYAKALPGVAGKEARSVLAIVVGDAPCARPFKDTREPNRRARGGVEQQEAAGAVAEVCLTVHVVAAWEIRTCGTKKL